MVLVSKLYVTVTRAKTETEVEIEKMKVKHIFPNSFVDISGAC